MQQTGRAALRATRRKLMRQNAALYVMLIPIFVYIILFHYWPMYGIQIAFRNFNFADGITGSPWVGTKWFSFFFKSNQFKMVVSNTLILNLYNLLAGFPVPILLALMIHSIGSKRYRRVVQTATYLPHFISVVVLVGMMSCMFSLNSGWVNGIIASLGGQPVHLMGEAKYFRHVYVWSGVWQEMGWNSIIYLAALTGIDPISCHTPDQTYTWRKYFASPIRCTGWPPRDVIMPLTQPELSENMQLIMPTSTTTEIKCGR